ncbi:MAG: tetratricopeptide repeat protein [Deltaproteobacteria bacterium]|nr:tetratricopeptide repeat protein [Deltaproteobacteria bacterium]
MSTPPKEPESGIAAHGRRAQRLLQQGDRAAARAEIERGWARWEAEEGRLAPPGQELLSLVLPHAWLLLQGGELDEARETIARGLESAPDHPELRFLRGCAHEARALSATGPVNRRVLLQEALADFERALEPVGEHHRDVGFLPRARGWAGAVRVATVQLLLGDLDQAGRTFDRCLELHAESREARWGKAECLLLRGDPEAAMKAVHAVLDDRPDGWVIAALGAEAGGLLDGMATLLDRARESLDRGFVAPHRAERHADAKALLSMYRGAPEPVSGPYGQLAALMLGRYEPVPLGGARGADVATVERLLHHLLMDGQTQWLVPLLQKEAEPLLPGVGQAVQDVIGSLGKRSSP